MKRKIKKLAILLSATMFLGACGNTAEVKQEETGSETSQTESSVTESQESTMETSEVESEVTSEMASGMASGIVSTETTQESQEESSTEEQEEVVEEGAVTETICPADVTKRLADRRYGTVEHITYHSETTGSDRGANILFPANYSEDKQYPVMYCLHGIFGDENSMIKDGNNKITEILGNLAAEGKAKEMIVVFPHMFASSDPNMRPGFTAEAMLPYDNFINDLVNDLMPYIESNYPVLTGRENTAILGFSMGGRETLFIGLSRPDLFGYIGAIAPAPGLTPGKDFFMEHVGQMQEEDVKFADMDILPNLLMICCGTRDSVVGKFPKGYHELMEKNGVEHLWYEVPNADHDNTAIKSGIYNFVIRWN